MEGLVKSLTFIRAPAHDTPEAVIDYLQAQSCTPPFRDVHQGPDGTFRGSGTRTSIEDMAAYEVIEDGEEP